MSRKLKSEGSTGFINHDCVVRFPNSKCDGNSSSFISPPRPPIDRPHRERSGSPGRRVPTKACGKAQSARDVLGSI